MRRKLSLAIFLRGAAGTLALLLLAAPAAALRGKAARVEGTVEVQRAGAGPWKALYPNEFLSPEDRIRAGAGGACAVVFDDGPQGFRDRRSTLAWITSGRTATVAALHRAAARGAGAPADAVPGGEVAPGPPPADDVLVEAERSGRWAAAAERLRALIGEKRIAAADVRAATLRLAAYESLAGRRAEALALLDPLLAGPTAGRETLLLFAARLRAQGGEGERARALFSEATTGIAPSTVAAIREAARGGVGAPGALAEAARPLERAARRARGYDRILLDRAAIALRRAAIAPRLDEISGGGAPAGLLGRVRLPSGPAAPEPLARAWRRAAEGDLDGARAALAEVDPVGAATDDARLLAAWIAPGDENADPAVVWFALALLRAAAGDAAGAVADVEMTAITLPRLAALDDFRPATGRPAAAAPAERPAGGRGTALATLAVTLVLVAGGLYLGRRAVALLGLLVAALLSAALLGGVPAGASPSQGGGAVQPVEVHVDQGVRIDDLRTRTAGGPPAGGALRHDGGERPGGRGGRSPHDPAATEGDVVDEAKRATDRLERSAADPARAAAAAAALDEVERTLRAINGFNAAAPVIDALTGRDAASPPPANPEAQAQAVQDALKTIQAVNAAAPLIDAVAGRPGAPPPPPNPAGQADAVDRALGTLDRVNPVAWIRWALGGSPPGCGLR